MTPAANRRIALPAISAAFVGAALFLAAALYPRLTGTEVRVHWPPMHADWLPRIGWLSVLPIVVGFVIVFGGRRVSERLAWRPFLGVAFLASWAWTMSLALVDGSSGLSSVFERKREYLFDAVNVTSVHAALTGFIDRIPIDSPDNWQTHVAGHPPGALLFFVLLDRLGINDPFWVGFTVLTLGTTAVFGGAIAIKVLAGEQAARRVTLWWVLAPAAIWMGVSGDAFFTAVSVWGLALLTLAATARRRPAMIGFGIGSGILLGLCVYLSYGLVLLGIIAIAVLFLARDWRPLPWAVGGALFVAASFTAAGFAWWEAFPVLRERYNDGIATDRPYSYWVWANIAAWTLTVGLATWAAFPHAMQTLRRREPRAVLAAAGLLCIVIATVSGMSKAEVERIWLPFTFWVLMLPAALPARWQRPMLASQVVTALLIQHLLLTRW